MRTIRLSDDQASLIKVALAELYRQMKVPQNRARCLELVRHLNAAPGLRVVEVSRK